MKKLDLDFIRSRRLELDKTHQEMADSLGMKNASTYLKYESGAYSLKAEHLPDLSNALKCNIADFFNNDVAELATN